MAHDCDDYGCPSCDDCIVCEYETGEHYGCSYCGDCGCQGEC